MPVSILQQLEAFPEARKACLLFRYEDLCAHPARLIDSIVEHCDLVNEKLSRKVYAE
jgi:hypothetical protein